MIAQDSSRTIWVWDRDSGALLQKLEHGSSATTVHLSADRKTLTTFDGTLRLWDLPQGKLRYAVVFFDDERIYFDGDGYYSGPKHLLPALAIRAGNRAYPFEQFDLRLNRPDLVHSRTGAVSPERIALYRLAYEKRLRRMGLTEADMRGELRLPEVAITGGETPVATRKSKLDLRVRGTDVEGLRALHVYADGVPIFGSRGRPPDADAREAEWGVTVELLPGVNRVEVSVTNTRGVESLREGFEVAYTEKPKKPSLRIAVIGVSKYVDPAYNLAFAAKDARDIASHFTRQKGKFTKIEVASLLDGEVTREKVASLREFFSKTTTGDTALLFVAGHGLLDGRLDYWFATSDVQFDAPGERGVAYETLEGLLDGIPARHKLLLMDTCHSGEVDDVVVAEVPEGVTVRAVGARGIQQVGQKKRRQLGDVTAELEDLFAELRRGGGARVISSAGGAEFALESAEWNNGVFTHAVLQGLAGGADTNRDGAIYVHELHEHVSREVVRLTSGRQRPTARRGGVEFDFSLQR